MGSANGTHCVEAMGSSLAAHTGVSPDLKRQCCALSLFANLKAGSPALNLIAREFSLDLGQATCRPQLVTHIPGLTNTACDALSRINDPDKQFKLLIQLSGAKAVLPKPRRLGWWKTLPHRLDVSPASQLQHEEGEIHQLAQTPGHSAERLLAENWLRT